MTTENECECTAVELANQVAFNSSISYMKHKMECGCWQCRGLAENEIDAIMDPHVTTQEFKNEMLDKLSKK